MEEQTSLWPSCSFSNGMLMCIIQNHILWGMFQRFPVKMYFRRIIYSNIDWIYNSIENELKWIVFICCETWRNLLVHQAQTVLLKKTTMCNCSYKFFKLCFENWFVQLFAQADIEKLFLNFFSLVLKKTNISCNFPLKFLACFVHLLLCQLALYFIPGADILISLKKRTM